jgi:hypothetical protein
MRLRRRMSVKMSSRRRICLEMKLRRRMSVKMSNRRRMSVKTKNSRINYSTCTWKKAVNALLSTTNAV